MAPNEFAGHSNFGDVQFSNSLLKRFGIQHRLEADWKSADDSFASIAPVGSLKPLDLEFLIFLEM